MSGRIESESERHREKIMLAWQQLRWSTDCTGSHKRSTVYSFHCTVKCINFDYCINFWHQNNHNFYFHRFFFFFVIIFALCEIVHEINRQIANQAIYKNVEQSKLLTILLQIFVCCSNCLERLSQIRTGLFHFHEHDRECADENICSPFT